MVASADRVMAHPDDGDALSPVLIEPELSALGYRERLLARAEDRDLPLLERAKFLAVFERSIDELFQVSVGRLDVRVEHDPRDLRTRRLAAELTAACHRLHRRAEAAGAAVLRELQRAGIAVCGWADLEAEERRFCREAFCALLLPALSPHLRVTNRRHLPFVRGGVRHLVVGLADRLTGAPGLAVLPLPTGLPRLVAMTRPGRFAVLDAIVGASLPRAFPDMDVTGHWSFRVTRPADAGPDEADGARTDLVAAVRRSVDRRRSTDRVVRLEIDAAAPADVRSALTGALGLAAERVYPTGPFDPGLVGSLHTLDRPDLQVPPARPVTARRLRVAAGGRAGVFDVLDGGDVLVHHPYEAFETSVEAFLQQAAADPDVVAIKQTLYRMSAPVSPVAESLIRAAEAGKDVLALVEIRARFDEEANIEWADTLERAGVHVVHGVLGLKTHAKIALVVRRERGTLRRYGHISTGNYNGDTAHEYEDVGILTADPDVGADLADLFNSLSGGSHPSSFRKLLVSPARLRTALVDLIRGQARPGGSIAIKVNHLVDRGIVAELCAASQAGAEVDLVVRATCCLRPGIRGRSEGIRVRSIMGRYLEHSRIFRFGRPGPDARYLVGSADLMPRNLDERIEALAPVEHPALRARLDLIFELAMADDVLAWDLRPDGTWRRAARGRGLDLQEALAEAVRPHDEPTRRAPAKFIPTAR